MIPGAAATTLQPRGETVNILRITKEKEDGR
jgi:hypothetical protein